MPVSNCAYSGQMAKVATVNRARRTERLSVRNRVLATAILCLLGVASARVKWAMAANELTPTRGSISSLGGKQVAGSDGAQYQLPGGMRVTLSAKSEATVVAQPQMLSLNAGKRTPTYSVFLKSGRIDVDIPTSAGGAVLVAAPADVRIICQRGTSSISASSQTTWASAEKFPLLVSQKERLSKLPAGTIRKFSQGAGPEDYRALEAPKWLAGRKLWLAVPETVKVSDFSWAPVAGAQSYRVELREATSGTLVADFAQVETQVKDRLPSLASGDYDLYVRAIDHNNMPGTVSKSMRLRIVGVDVPYGAKLQPDARIEMSRSQTIQLKNADGLSLKRATERVVRSASEPVGIADGQPTPLMIQDGDSANACLMWLLPSRSPIAAYVGPKWVIWPHEFVDLAVHWTDQVGRRLPDDVEPTVTVYVGIEPVDVPWEKHADVWRARLGPQPGHGPWVVRLEVRDQTGGILARDFVEVVRRPRQRFVTATADLAGLTRNH
jgi:hypothetical protein